MNKKYYAAPDMYVIRFINGETTNLNLSTVQSNFSKTSYSAISGSKNKINF